MGTRIWTDTCVQRSNDTMGMGKDKKEQLKPLADFKQRIKADAEKAVFEVMPEKVQKLTDIINDADYFKLSCTQITPDFSFADERAAASGTDNSAEGTSRKRRRVDDDGEHQMPDASGRVCYPYMVASNKVIRDFHNDVLKVEVQAAIKCINTVKVWIMLSIPKIQD